MLHSLWTLSGRLVRGLATQIVISRRFLALRILCRCLPGRPLYRLVPFAYTVSAIIQLVFLAVFSCSLWSLFIASRSNWPTVCALVIAIALARVRFGSHAAVGLLACLTLLPNQEIETSTRIAIGAALGFFALITWWESHKRIAQFRFKPFYLRNIDEGSAGILQGKVHVFHLFVDTEKVWSPVERSEVREISTQALSWLITQASNFRVKLEFTEHEIWQSQKAIQAIPDAGASLSDHQVFGKWLDAVLDQQLQDRERTLNTNACLLIHIKDRMQTSWAYAVPKYKFDDRMCQLEYAVLGAPHDASVVAHELLHLFGADDFYLAAYWGGSYNEPQPREQLLGDCIMFTTKSEISNSLVDDLTAQSVGWL